MKLAENQRERLRQGLSLSESVLHEVFEELKIRYEGVCSEEFIKQSIGKYVLGSYAFELIDIISHDIFKGCGVLDIGSGFGNFVNATHFLGCRSAGIEPSAFEVKISELHSARLFESGQGPRFIPKSFEDADVAEGEFDVVTLWNVVEHIPDLVRVLTFVRRVMKSDGVLYVICPNYFSWSTEPHYRIPWNPLIGTSRKRAQRHLLQANRSLTFFDESIYPRSNWEVLREFRKAGFVPRALTREGNHRTLRRDLLDFAKIRLPIKPTISLRLTKEP